MLEKEPNKFMCLWKGEWTPCTKEEICERGLVPGKNYHIDEDEPEYLDNWVQ